MIRRFQPPPTWVVVQERQLLRAIGSAPELTPRDRLVIRWMAHHDLGTVEALVALLSHVRGAR
jgi:hypothetical protein